ncbi:MAG: LacI family DNA-binding transcriptional regulator [Kiritimatiellae bacterium]|nr:LacI family DNA-binding transcriptional regulator [Kiritimatiellia bacterium]
MADVARAAGVHQTTVSRALRGDPALPAETRRRLTELAEEMGYRRNPFVSALIAERKRGKPSGHGAVLAVLSAGANPSRWRNRSASYTHLYHFMREQAEALGYHLEEFALETPDLTPERLRQILLSRGIRGIVVPPMPIEVKAVEFDFSDFAAVALRLHLPRPAIDRVVPDYFFAMVTALDKLVETGHRRIGFITDMRIDERVRHRSLGAYLAARQFKPKQYLAPKIVDRWEPEAFHAWLRRVKPDAILTPIHSDWLWVGQTLAEGGWEVPRQLSLASLDCHTDTPEAGIAYNLELEASSAIKLLARKVECAEFGIPKESSRLTISGKWRDGELFAPRTVPEPSSVKL